MSDRFDLEGVTPESWACIDCGINTWPSCPNRIEMERQYKTAEAIKKLMGKAPPFASLTVDEHCEVYMVRDSVWKAAGLEPMGGCICIGCLERRLGRRLKPKDFHPRDPFNWLPGTERLIERGWLGEKSTGIRERSTLKIQQLEMQLTELRAKTFSSTPPLAP